MLMLPPSTSRATEIKALGREDPKRAHGGAGGCSTVLSPLAHVVTTSLLAQECVSGTRSHSGTVRSGTVARISSTAPRSCFLLILLRIVPVQ